MQFVNIRELSRSPSKYIKAANKDDDIIITRNGHPYAMLLKINDNDLEDFILAKHFDLENEFKIAKIERQSGDTTNIQNLLNDIDN
jgi:prevent-host-death family protein